MIKIDINKYNKILKHKSPNQIINWALNLTENRLVTTSFGVYSSVLLSTFAQKDPDIKVIWCDTLYNTDETYNHARSLIDEYGLNIKYYKPLKSKNYIDSVIGVPNISDEEHTKFTELVKLEPFKRAMLEHQPEVWFTNIRVRQTAYRNSKDILSYSKEGILKISPFYYWSDDDLDEYILENNLTKNESYFDPTKVLKSRECGIHFQ